MIARPILLMLLLLSVSAGFTSTSALAQDAPALLGDSAKRMSELESFAFAITTTNGTTKILDTLEISSIEGVVKRPDQFQAAVTVKLPFAELKLTAIGIGDQLWITDPLSSTGSYIDLTAQSGSGAAATTVLSILNPDALLLRAAQFVENPVIAGTEELDGVQTTKLTGTIDLNKVLVALTATPEAGADWSFLDLTPKDVTIWIDGDNRLVRLELTGPLIVNETAGITRRLDLSKFDEPVEITAPSA